MRIVGVVVVVLAVMLADGAHADPEGTCIELHCYCNGLGSPSTVAPCSSTCYDVCGTSSGSPTGAGVRPAHLSRFYAGITAARGFSAAYTNGRTVRGESQVGGQLEAVFGRPTIGFAMFVDLARDAGTTPDGSEPPPMWLLDLGIGLVASPFAIHGGRREVRPELGIYGYNLFRLGCDVCDTDAGLGQQKPAQANQGVLWRLRAGIDIYLGAKQGLAIDALIQFGKLGDASDPLTSAVLTPPRVLLRLSWIPVRDR